MVSVIVMNRLLRLIITETTGKISMSWTGPHLDLFPVAFQIFPLLFSLSYVLCYSQLLPRLPHSPICS